MKKINSEIMNSLNKIIKTVSIVIIPIGALLFFHQLGLEGNTVKNAVVNTVAAIIGMIPEGLVLLTSTVLAVSIIRLSKTKVLVQELYCIETLARVDTLCLDKTGTLTEGCMEVKDFLPVNKTKAEMKNIMINIAMASEDENATIEAIRNYFTKPESLWTVKKKVAFSSQTKWSGITFEEKGTFILGAPEIVLKEAYPQNKEVMDKYIKDYRVLVITHSPETLNGKELPENMELIGYIFLLDKIRKEAKQTLKYFEKQGVDIKIIQVITPLLFQKLPNK